MEPPSLTPSRRRVRAAQSAIRSLASRGTSPAFTQRARIACIEASGRPRQVHEVLGCALAWPVWPATRGGKGVVAVVELYQPLDLLSRAVGQLLEMRSGRWRCGLPRPRRSPWPEKRDRESRHVQNAPHRQSPSCPWLAAYQLMYGCGSVALAWSKGGGGEHVASIHTEQDVLEFLELLERLSSPQRHTCQGVIGDGHREPRSLV